MELNLESARVAREVEVRIKAELDRLPVRDQKSVLERVALDVMMTLEASGRSAPVRSGAIHSATPRASKVEEKAAANGSDKSLGDRILAYCQAHPATKYGTIQLAEAVMPGKLAQNRNVARSMVFTAMKRRSVDDSDDPYFVFLGSGNFRLASEEERAKAKEKGAAP
jgi:hypothetical protein